jgi:6-pyruvoyltetrahydropterin/6-carboxytetrahydropterin synthase
LETYTVHVTKDYLVFCAAHFISYEKSRCERIHGHNYRVAAEVSGPLDENYLVLDFIDLKHILRKLTDELDHRVVLPRRNPVLRIEEGPEEVTVRYFDKKRWVFPREDCCLLDIHNSTAEEMARWLADRLLAEFAAAGFARPLRILVEVEESPGQSARYERQLAEPAAPVSARR